MEQLLAYLSIFTDAGRWVWTFLLIPLGYWIGMKIKRLFQRVATLEREKEELEKCVLGKLQEIKEGQKITNDKIDRNSQEHAELEKLVVKIATNQEWLMKNNGLEKK